MTSYDRTLVNTPLGVAEIVGDLEGIISVSILDDKIEASKIVPESLQECVKQLNEYFSGDRKEFSLKLNPKGTTFQKKVWKALQAIPYGATSTYMKQSLELGNSKAIRAVAAANGKNPLWIIIPCHRVIGSDGSLTGYAGGIWRKKWLLEYENPTNQTSLF